MIASPGSRCSQSASMAPQLRHPWRAPPCSLRARGHPIRPAPDALAPPPEPPQLLPLPSERPGAPRHHSQRASRAPRGYRRKPGSHRRRRWAAQKRTTIGEHCTEQDAVMACKHRRKIPSQNAVVPNALLMRWTTAFGADPFSVSRAPCATSDATDTRDDDCPSSRLCNRVKLMPASAMTPLRLRCAGLDCAVRDSPDGRRHDWCLARRRSLRPRRFGLGRRSGGPNLQTAVPATDFQPSRRSRRRGEGWRDKTS